MRLVSEILLICALIAAVPGCTPPATQPTSQDPQGSTAQNIAAQVLPGDWQVVGESIVFSFDEQGVPTAVSNPANPSDPATNLAFNKPATLTTPDGQATINLVPGTPYIDSLTGQSNFSAAGTLSDVLFKGLPLLGQGHATYTFAGQYDSVQNELTGHSETKVFFGLLPIFSDSKDYVLQKLP